ATATCDGRCLCRPWSEYASTPISKPSTLHCSNATKPKCRPSSPSHANYSTPSTASSKQTDPSMEQNSSRNSYPGKRESSPLHASQREKNACNSRENLRE